MLTARNLPQPLALISLFLLLTAAATLLACGPAASAPADRNTLPPAQQAGDADPTEPPPPPPVPAFIYPNIGDSQLHFDVVEFEEAQDAASGTSGQSDTAPEDAVVFVQILLSGNKAEVAAWLRSKGVTPLHAENPQISNLTAEVPLSLLGELSQQDGVREIHRPAPSFLPIE